MTRRRIVPFATLALLVGLLSLWTVHPARAATVQVAIVNFAYQPATITVPLGTTVTWTNMDTDPHTATSDSGVWDTPILGKNQSASFTFNQAGTFPYHCTVHPYMHGTVVVQGTEPPTNTPGPAPPPPPGPPAATSTPTPTATPVPPTATPTLPAPSKGQKQVLATEVKGKHVFKPLKLTVKVGTKVVWVNRSAAPHTVTSKAKSWKYNKKLNLRKSLSFTFRKPGTYKYICLYHPGMDGTIVVKR